MDGLYRVSKGQAFDQEVERLRDAFQVIADVLAVSPKDRSKTETEMVKLWRRLVLAWRPTEANEDWIGPTQEELGA